jgi:hypothetical protein
MTCKATAQARALSVVTVLLACGMLPLAPTVRAQQSNAARASASSHTKKAAASLADPQSVSFLPPVLYDTGGVQSLLGCDR